MPWRETTNACGCESVIPHSTARRVDSKTLLTTIEFTPNGCSGRFISLRYYVCCSSLRQTLNRSSTLGMNAVPSGVDLLFCLVSAYTVLMFRLDEVLRASQSFFAHRAQRRSQGGTHGSSISSGASRTHDHWADSCRPNHWHHRSDCINEKKVK